MAEVEHLIIGGGHAGATAAITLRRLGATGSVLMVSQEQEYPYQRPPLSKEFLRGQRQRDRLFLRRPDFYQQQGIQVRLGTRAVGLDPARRTVTLDSGQELTYQRLLLATGAVVRRLPIPGADLPGVYYLRTLADSEALRQEKERSRRAVIIGGGFIGAEVAASLTQAGLEVTVVDVVPTIWVHILGEEMGRFFHQALARRGVRFLTPAHVERIEGQGRAQRVVTQEGHQLPCDFVVVGVGVTPDTALAQQGGLEVDRKGIVVNEYLETSQPGVFAAGDATLFYSPLFGTRLHVEHWDLAGQHGQAVARNMLGHRVPFSEVPYFFSGLFDLWMDYLGYAPQWDRLAVRRLEPEKFTAFYIQDGLVKAALMVNNGKDMKPCRELIASRSKIADPTVLEDPSRDLAQIASV